MRNLFFAYILCVGLFLSSAVMASDWLKDAYEDSHNIEANPYAADIEAGDLFDTQIDLLKTIKKTIEKWETVDSLINAYKKGKPLKGKLGEAMEKYMKWEISKVQLAEAIWSWLVEDVKNNIVENDSIFVRFARFLLRLAVILAIPMIILGALKLIWARGDEGKMKEALQQIGYVAAGILLALASVMIIFLITALMRSSLKFFG